MNDNNTAMVINAIGEMQTGTDFTSMDIARTVNARTNQHIDWHVAGDIMQWLVRNNLLTTNGLNRDGMTRFRTRQ